MTIRVVLGEDSDLMREAILGILEQIDGVELVAACGDATRLRTTIDELLPDVVLTDIRMPPSGTDEGIRVADDLRTSHPEIGVVVLSQHAEPFYVLTLLAGGSAGRAYLLKDGLRDRTQLSRAIREVGDGGSVVDARIVEILLASRARRHDAKLSALTSRDLDDGRDVSRR
jgi:DNA-binding NarL/FixJ family response regulator